MTATSIVFVDSRVANYQDLINSLPPGSEVYVLDSTSDGLDQMATYLQGRTGLDAIHIISHGSVGTLYLGSTVLNSDNLAQYQTQLTTIGQALTFAGDILLYGCDVGQGEVGQAFIAQLAAVTGADVAASTDLTGAVVLGGDWALEALTGNIESVQPSLLNDSFQGLLGTPIIASQSTNYDLSTFVDLAAFSYAAYSVGSSLTQTVEAMGWQLTDEASPTNLINFGLVPVKPHVFAAERTINGEKQMVIAFRGTDGIVDFITDLGSSQGFSEYWISVRSSVQPWVEKAIAGQYDKIYLTGHSLGGAVAQVAMLDLLEDSGRSIWKNSPLLSSVFNFNDRFITDADGRAWLNGHVVGATFGAPPAQPLVGLSLNPLIDVSNYSDRFFQFEHKNGAGSDPVAAIPGVNVGIEIPIQLDDLTYDRYHSFVSGFEELVAVHKVLSYEESLLRLLSDAPFLASGISPELVTYIGSGTGTNDLVRPDAAHNAIGYAGNDLLVVNNGGDYHLV